MNRILGSGLFLVLAACASPQEQCIQTATKDLNVLRTLIAESEATIERGYALQTEQRLIAYTNFCVGHYGDVGVTFCREVQPVTRTKPVAVDLDEERRKLKSLKRKERELVQKSDTMIAQCKAQFPET